MPFIRIQAKEGRSPELKAKVAERIIEVMVEAGFAQPQAIRVIYEDMASHDYYTGQDYQLTEEPK